jgi:hypothetical protein
VVRGLDDDSQDTQCGRLDKYLSIDCHTSSKLRAGGRLAADSRVSAEGDNCADLAVVLSGPRSEVGQSGCCLGLIRARLPHQISTLILLESQHDGFSQFRCPGETTRTLCRG